MTKPFYRFAGRDRNPPYGDRLTWQNEHNPQDRINTSVWWYWRLWRFAGLHWVANPSTSPECGGCGWPYDFSNPGERIADLGEDPLAAVEQHVHEMLAEVHQRIP